MGMDIPLAAIKSQIASAVDIIIHLGRLRDKSRRVLSICEVLEVEMGEIKLNTLFEFVEIGEINSRINGRLRKVNDVINADKLMQAGLYNVYKELEKTL